MTDYRRFAAVLLMLLSQVTAGLVVMCEESGIQQILEILPQSCCETTLDAGSSSSAGDEGQDPCCPCLGIPLVSFPRAEVQSSLQFELAFVATLPDTPLTNLSTCGVLARDITSHAAISTTVAQLAGTVVLLC